MTTIHPKVFASTIGSGIGGTLSALVLWILGVTAWHSPASATGAEAAIAAVPAPVVGAVVLALTVGTTFTAGWLAKSVPDLSAVLDSYAEPIDSEPVENAAASEADPAAESDPGEPVPAPADTDAATT